MAPTAARLRHASLTVVGDTPSWRASSRTVGNREPTASSPDVISRPMAAAMPFALRSLICERSVKRMYGHNRSIVQDQV